MDIQFNTPSQELKPHEITPQQIKEACCEAFGVSSDEVDDSKNLAHHVCWARHSTWLFLRRIKNYSYGTIADECDLPRATIQYGVASITRAVKMTPVIRDAIEEAGKILKCMGFVRGFIAEISNAA